MNRFANEIFYCTVRKHYTADSEKYIIKLKVSDEFEPCTGCYFFDKYTCPVWDVIGNCRSQHRIFKKYKYLLPNLK